MIREIKHSRYLMGNLDYGSDLLNSLTYICEKENIVLGRLELIGAVQKARIGYYLQDRNIYTSSELNDPMEITSLTGNISLKDGKPFVHAHINLANAEGNVLGGHLLEGTVVFAAEFIIQTFEGPEFSRIFDDHTKLALWK